MEKIARIRECDGQAQLLADHLTNVALITSVNMKRLGMPKTGELLGLLHDLGKYSSKFQNYIRSAGGLVDQDSEDFIDPNREHGKIDHSTAGAQFLIEGCSQSGKKTVLASHIVAICLVSHHSRSGLIDAITPDGCPNLQKRLMKDIQLTYYKEVIENCDINILNRIEALIAERDWVEEIFSSWERINGDTPIIRTFKLGQLIRISYSCLIDGDRTDTINFKYPNIEAKSIVINWQTLNERLEIYLKQLNQNCQNNVDSLREKISNDCKKSANREKGIYTLQVPTGGGKTLSSLRYALNHAQKHNLERIFYIIPFTTIIDQNAEEIRHILDSDSQPNTSFILEHHSNLTPEEESWQGKIYSDNWGTQIIFTTNVQFFEVILGGGTRNVRRMHQLTNSIIIFDEIQNIPIKCIHLFNNTINFLVENCGTSVLLCTATMPLLNSVDPLKGACKFTSKSDLVENVDQYFLKLKRNDILDRQVQGGYSNDEIATMAIEELNKNSDCLIIVNTKSTAESIYHSIIKKGFAEEQVFLLSTDLCPMHRKNILEKIKQKLHCKNKIICVSTQLIEAGINIDFECVIRCIAGFDSIIQAAGRCNRHGLRKSGKVYIVNINEEKLEKLPDIQIGQDKAKRVISDFLMGKIPNCKNLDSVEVIQKYYEYYFYYRQMEMDYPISERNAIINRSDTLLNILSINPKSLEKVYKNFQQNFTNQIVITQSFSSASKVFKIIEAPTRGIIVPYLQSGIDIISQLCASNEPAKQYSLLKLAQQYSVNLYEYRFEKIFEYSGIHEISNGSGIYYLEESFYNQKFGISDIPVIKKSTLMA